MLVLSRSAPAMSCCQSLALKIPPGSETLLRIWSIFALFYPSHPILSLSLLRPWGCRHYQACQKVPWSTFCTYTFFSRSQRRLPNSTSTCFDNGRSNWRRQRRQSRPKRPDWGFSACFVGGGRGWGRCQEMFFHKLVTREDIVLMVNHHYFWGVTHTGFSSKVNWIMIRGRCPRGFLFIVLLVKKKKLLARFVFSRKKIPCSQIGLNPNHSTVVGWRYYDTVLLFVQKFSNVLV